MISSPENLQAWLRLSLTPGVGNITARALLQEFGQPEAIFERSAAELQALVSKAISQQLRVIPVGLEKAFETTWQWLHNQVQIGTSQIANASVLTLADAEYPSSLFLTPDPPLLLYVLGQTQHLHLLSPPP